MRSYESRHVSDNKRRPTSESGYEEMVKYDGHNYSSIIFTNFPNMHSNDIYEELSQAFNHIRPFNIQITSHKGQTVAYLNFEDPKIAGKAYRESVNELRLFDGHVCVCPVIRGQRTRPVKVRGRLDSKRNKETFLSRRKPRENNEPCRVLFVGNLGPNVDSVDIEEVFSKYGVVEKVQIRSNDDGIYCFVNFADMVMATEAKRNAADIRFGKYECVIGYGKSMHNRCLYVGNVTISMKDEVLKSFERFGRILRDFWPPGANCCYLLYDKLDSSLTAYRKMHDFVFQSQKNPILLDFALPEHMTDSFARKCRKFRDFGNYVTLSPRGTVSDISCDDENVEIPPGSPYSPIFRDEQKIENAYSLSPISDDANKFFTNTLAHVRDSETLWDGNFLLKGTHVPVLMKYVKGRSDMIDYFMYKHQMLSNGINSKQRDPVVLSIVNRLRLDSDKLAEVQRTVDLSDGGYCVLVAFPSGSGSNLHSLNEYLLEKNAAGVIFISVSYSFGGVEKKRTAIIHAFPKCEFARNLLNPVISSNSYESFDDDFLTILIVSNGFSSDCLISPLNSKV